MSLERQLKIALDESRLLILGAQVLFGFQFNGIFQDLFAELPIRSRALACAGLPLIMLTIALLVAPSMQHRIVERGQDSPRILALATLLAGWALLPLAIALAFDLFIAMERIGAAPLGAVAAAGFFALAMACWYALELHMKAKRFRVREDKLPPKPTPIETQVNQLLTEARIIIPGAQALLGFQLTVTLTRAFQQLPPESKMAHAAALCLVALSVVLLMAPASLHRIAFGGQDDAQFIEIGSVFVVSAPAALAFGIALDTYVAGRQALESATAGAVLAAAAIITFLGAWYVCPVSCRWNERRARAATSG